MRSLQQEGPPAAIDIYSLMVNKKREAGLDGWLPFFVQVTTVLLLFILKYYILQRCTST